MGIISAFHVNILVSLDFVHSITGNSIIIIRRYLELTHLKSQKKYTIKLH